MIRHAGLVALLLALLLPLQGLAFATGCGASPALHAGGHCAGHDHALPAHAAHHDCGTCCCMAVAMQSVFLPGRAPTAVPVLPPAASTHPLLPTDRLDRPPRA